MENSFTVKMLWFLFCTLMFHHVAAVERDTNNIKDPVTTMSEIMPSSVNYKARVVFCNLTVYCPDENTCCRFANLTWGCCPLPQAVCCPDHVHCCPNGQTCTSEGKCILGSHVIKQLKKTPAIQAKNVICPDQESQCPDGNTCCKLKTGGWGCCPLPEAVCCPDGVHCCPNGYTCTSEGSCERESHVTKLFKKTPAIKAKNVICPDQKSQCPDGSTCCKVKNGGWGCCPFSEAVCCPDGLHCCPDGYTCASGGFCERESHVTKLFKKTPAIKAKNVICPDGQSECPNHSTCCKLVTGQYGCCPLPSAVCCNDGVHCCPEGYICDVSAGTCSQQGDLTNIFAKKLTIRAAQAINKVCPGGQYQCPTGDTCCPSESGGWSCCPLPKAVCCSDKEHCCPNGYICSTSSRICFKESHVTKLFKKKPATLVSKEVKMK